MSQVPLSSEERFSGTFKPGMCDEPMQNPLPKYDGDPWKVLYKHISEPDLARCKAWREEVENLLIFAGLFSAVVTAFIIESYKSLREDYGDTSTALLRRIALHLEGNGTVTVQPSAQAFSPSSSSVRINVLWFLSLVLSLSTVLFGTLCLQWLREHLNLPTRPRDAVALHHMQKESLDRWRVPEIFTALPLLLQSGLILFLVGIVDFLWQLHHTVAGVLLAAIALTLIFYVVTTVAPAIQDLFLCFPHPSRLPRSPCPYRSPQSLLFLRVVRPVITYLQKHLPKAWLWDRYWAKYDDDCSHSIIECFTSEAHKHVASWTRHHRRWLLQREHDVSLFHRLPQFKLWASRYTLMNDSPTTFYDHIPPISMNLYSTSTGKSLIGSGSPALAHCLESFIEDVQNNTTKIPPMPSNTAMAALTNFTIWYSAPNAEMNTIPSHILQDFLVSHIIYSRQGLHDPLGPYILEKCLRVIYSLLKRGSAAPQTTSTSLSATYCLLRASMEHLDHESYLPPLQSLLNGFLEEASVSPFRDHPSTMKLATYFMCLCAHRLYRYLGSIPVHQRHILMLQTLVKLFKGSSHSRAFVAVIASHYFLALFRSGNHRLELTLEESRELLLLLQSYRRQCLYGTDARDGGRSKLLALQKIVIADPESYHWGVGQQPLHSHLWKDYLIGMFDMSDATDDDTDEVKGFYKSRAYGKMLFCRQIVGTYVHAADQHSRGLGQVANVSWRNTDVVASERGKLFRSAINYTKLTEVTNANPEEPEEVDPEPVRERSTTLLKGVELGVIRDEASATLQVDSTTAGPSQTQLIPVNPASFTPEHEGNDQVLPRILADSEDTEPTNRLQNHTKNKAERTESH